MFSVALQKDIDNASICKKTINNDNDCSSIDSSDDEYDIKLHKKLSHIVCKGSKKDPNCEYNSGVESVITNGDRTNNKLEQDICNSAKDDVGMYHLWLETLFDFHIYISYILVYIVFMCICSR